MINPELSNIIEDIAEMEKRYRPNTTVARAMGGIAFNPFIGIPAAGKSTMIDELLKLYPSRYHFVKSRTTRPPKPGEDINAMHFLKSDRTAMEGMRDDVANGEYVQFAVHPKTHAFYGTTLEDYDHNKMNLMPTLASTIDTLRNIGFRSVNPIVIVPEIAAWKRTFSNQIYSNSERHKRLQEADASLAYCLKNRDDIEWVHNRHGAPDQTARDIHSLLHGELDDEELAARRNEAIAVGIRLRTQGVQRLLHRSREMARS